MPVEFQQIPLSIHPEYWYDSVGGWRDANKEMSIYFTENVLMYDMSKQKD